MCRRDSYFPPSCNTLSLIARSDYMCALGLRHCPDRRRLRVCHEPRRPQTQCRATAHDYGALDDILQLTNIAWPVMPLKQVDRFVKGCIRSTFPVVWRTSERSVQPAAGYPPRAPTMAVAKRERRLTGSKDRRGRVNAPRSCPKSSLSSKAFGIAAQLRATKRFPRRGLAS